MIIENPDIANPTGVAEIDSLIHRLLDAQQDINLEANERMSQPLCDASALIDDVEVALRKMARKDAPEPIVHLVDPADNDMPLAAYLALRDARALIAEAMEQHIYNTDDGEKPAPDCRYQAMVNRLDSITSFQPRNSRALEFLAQIARMTTPEDEFEAKKGEDGTVYDDGITYEDADELISDMSDDRLCSEAHALWDTIRQAREIIREPLPTKIIRTTLQDYRILEGETEDVDGSPIDARPWPVEIELQPGALLITAHHPDDSIPADTYTRSVWLEINEDRFVAHCYDPGHDEPINLRIGKNDTTMDSDRGSFRDIIIGDERE